MFLTTIIGQMHADLVRDRSGWEPQIAEFQEASYYWEVLNFSKLWRIDVKRETTDCGRGFIPVTDRF